MEKLNVDAFFLGPKSENQEFFKEMLNFMMEDHLEWRKDFHPHDNPAITREDQEKEDFKDTILRTRHALVELAADLQMSSIPWFSPRYLGHMTSDTLMAANLGYMLTILYNPNNCAYEGSPATTRLEIEVGMQLARMMGYNEEQAWGHITSGGTIANYEGLWMARNLKSIPLAIRDVRPELLQGHDDWQLLNMSTGEILDMLDPLRESTDFEEVRKNSARGIGVEPGKLGKLLVPQTKHYSWTKAADILGVGQENLVYIRVRDDYRMDIDHLRETIDHLIEQQIPVLGVVGVVGTTEEGAVDDIHGIVKMREEYNAQDVSFYLHIDAAYGGYARALFLDDRNRFLSYHDLKSKLREIGVVSKDIDWPDRDVYNAFKSIPEADSITIDPHKMGYIPYATGAVLAKDKRILDLISYFAAYVFHEKDGPHLLGSYIMEGSKAGATVAATWVAHRVVPLNITGYGRIIGRGIEGAQNFYYSLLYAEPFDIDGRRFKVFPLTKPDFNMVDFSFNEIGNQDLEWMNRLNQKIFDHCSYKSGPVYTTDFLTSKTELSYQEYSDAPKSFIMKLGIPESEWNRVRSVYVLRSSVVTPFLIKYKSYDEYWGNFMTTMRGILEKILPEM